MPLSTTFAGLAARALGFGADVLSGYIFDSFAATQTPLSIADTGQTWVADSGTWNASSGEAIVTSISGELSPRAVILFKANTNATLFEVTNGGGIIFWRIDDSNWCSGIMGNSFNSGTGIYTWSIAIIQSVSGTISNVASSLVTTTSTPTSPINSLKIVTTGNSISLQAFSDGSCATTIGSPLTWTNSGVKGNGVGIVMSSGVYAPTQGTTVGPFTAR